MRCCTPLLGRRRGGGGPLSKLVLLWRPLQDGARRGGQPLKTCPSWAASGGRCPACSGPPGAGPARGDTSTQGSTAAWTRHRYLLLMRPGFGVTERISNSVACPLFLRGSASGSHPPPPGGGGGAWQRQAPAPFLHWSSLLTRLIVSLGA